MCAAGSARVHADAEARARTEARAGTEAATETARLGRVYRLGARYRLGHVRAVAVTHVTDPRHKDCERMGTLAAAVSACATIHQSHQEKCNAASANLGLDVGFHHARGTCRGVLIGFDASNPQQ
jgi:hypothetical protein